MAYFALIEKNIVLQVIVADSKEWCEKTFGGTWVETRKEEGKKFAGVGDCFYHEKKDFIKPRPFQSWVMDENLNWKAPKENTVDRAKDLSSWNEATQNWIKGEKITDNLTEEISS